MRPFTKVGIATCAAAGLMVGGASVGGALAAGGGGNLSPASDGGGGVASTHAKRVFAVVKPDGTAGRGRGFKSSEKLNTGTYDVRFNRNIKKCVWQGTVGQGNFSGSSGPGEISITGRNGTKNGLFVTTFDSAGNAKDLPFLALVVCS